MSETNATKQSINQTRIANRHCEIRVANRSNPNHTNTNHNETKCCNDESVQRFKEFADLLIRYCIIAIHNLLDSRDLDCFALLSQGLAMTNKKSESMICLAMTKRGAIRFAMTKILHFTPPTKDSK